TSRATALLRITAPTPREYLCDDHSKKRLNGRKSQPKPRSMKRSSQSRASSADLEVDDTADLEVCATGSCERRGFSSTADSAGLSVNELNAEMTVEIAIVMANCL